MGAVSIDIHKAEREYYILNLSDVNVVKWLISFRDKVDMYFKSKVDFSSDSAGDVKRFNQELIHTYVSLDEAIEKSKLNQKQLQLIELVSIGYTFKDIAELSGENEVARNVSRRFDTICKIISQTNDQIWSEWVTGNITHGALKSCGRCQIDLPMNSKFFGKDIQKKDGLKNVCKKCEKDCDKNLANLP